MKITIPSWTHGSAIPSTYAFGQIPTEGRFELGGNVSPPISWENAPQGTKSYALICHDPDVPSSAENVNQEGKTVPADLARVDFFHWVLLNIPADKTELTEGEASAGVTPRGKTSGQRTYGTAGLNNYTQWFAGDADMEGNYADYDGPCPPWNDSIMHHYHFTVYALDQETISIPEPFDGHQALAAIQPHILDKASYMGTYTMNRDLTPSQ